MKKIVAGLTCGRIFKEGAAQRDFVNVSYTRAITAAGALAILLPVGDPACAADYLDRVDGLLLPGGVDVDPDHYGQEPHPNLGEVDGEQDAFEIAVAREAWRRRLPIFAICRGIQLLNVALGGTLIQDLPAQAPSAITGRPLRARIRPTTSWSMKTACSSSLPDREWPSTASITRRSIRPRCVCASWPDPRTASLRPSRAGAPTRYRRPVPPGGDGRLRSGVAGAFPPVCSVAIVDDERGNRMYRREFLKAASALPAAAGFNGAFADKTPRVGLIGTGWYGKCDLFRLIQVAPVEVVSVCDVDSMLAERPTWSRCGRRRRRSRETYADYREMLKEKDLDIVLIGRRTTGTRSR